MIEQKLIQAGAECVCGDLILDRVCVGRYRNGQFILTDEGALHALTLTDASPAPAPEAAPEPQGEPVVEAAPAPQTRARRARAQATPEPSVADAAVADLAADLPSAAE